MLPLTLKFFIIIFISFRGIITEGLSSDGRVPRRLEVVSQTINGQPYCWETDTGLQGEVSEVVEHIDTGEHCQSLCRASPSCEYFSYAAVSHLCVFYSAISALKGSADIVSGSKYCPASGSSPPPGRTSTASPKTSPSSTNASSAGRLVSPGELLLLMDNVKSSSAANHTEKQIDLLEEGSLAFSEDVFSSATQIPAAQGSNLITGLLPGSGHLFGGNGLLGGVQSILSGGSGLLGGGNGLLGGVTSVLGNVRNPSAMVEGSQEGISAGLSTAEALLAASNTFLKTFPLSDLIGATADLASSIKPAILRDGVKGGVSPTAKNKESATAGPTGVGAPEVSCLSEGMKCCVPSAAVPKYQTNPPKLNGVNTPRCTATYSSVKDQLCITTKYTDDECNTILLETEDFFVYRNILEIPSKTMNDAICECVISKSSVAPDPANNQIEVDVPSITGSSRWQYSLVAQEDQRENNFRVAKAFERLEDGASFASKVTTTYAKNLESQGLEVGAEGSKAATTIIEAIGDLGAGLKSFTK